MKDELRAATEAQERAARPEQSTWVSANAGSGKTRVLTDRVARLLLNRADPARILCLTFTKAAAAEMQSRLFQRLGSWALLDDGELRAELTAIGERGNIFEEARLNDARTLFARALETPGGLKIQTIHAFCAQILRRFPVEAGVSPQFTEMDERQIAQLQNQIVETIASEPGTNNFDGLAAELTDEGSLSKILDGIQKHREAVARADRDLMAGTLEVDPNATEDTINMAALEQVRAETLRIVYDAFVKFGGTDEKKFAPMLKTALGNRPAQERITSLESVFLTKPGGRRSTSRFPTQAVKKALPDAEEIVSTIIEIIFEAKNRKNALRNLNRSEAFNRFARDYLERYEAAKADHGLLDFDDLISRVRHLLADPSVADWVLYRLDEGIDHILVDEAQDTSPAQWDVIKALEAAFSDGAGARSDINRTLFVVGDKKQSIFGFQGADPDAFNDHRDHFEARRARVNQSLQITSLEYSFRSAKPILALVDTVFAIPEMPALDDTVIHRSFPEKPGRVDLWRWKPNQQKSDPPDWNAAVDEAPRSDPVNLLAGEIADHMAELIFNGAQIPGKDGPRPVTPGDILVLVRSRTRFFHTLISALKTRNVPVAGADRLHIGDELAVRDLLSLLRFLDADMDDLALAETLRSPIFGLTEGQLFQLAHGRGKRSLWSVLSDNAHHRAISTQLDRLRRAANFTRPYELLEMVLGEMGARRRMVARMGVECEDAIDELLRLALSYEQTETPSLGGFLNWFAAVSTPIKRDLDGGRNEVRIMTVHGAKGLESPIVYLPDIVAKNNQTDPVTEIDGFAFWRPAKEQNSPPLQEDLTALRERENREAARLLYVGLTRAENWLIVAGAGDEKNTATRWYNAVQNAMTTLGATAPADPGENAILTLRHNWTTADHGPPAAASGSVPVDRPDWLDARAAVEQRAPRPLNPSKLGEPTATAGRLDPETARLRGIALHRLLETLPLHAEEDRAGIATALCPDAPDLARIACDLVAAPHLSRVFAADALVEVGISAPSGRADHPRLLGRIDRLLVMDGEVYAIDFKSHSQPPTEPGMVPTSIAAQMGAYAHGLAAIYPDRQIRSYILWTETADLMELPHDLVTEAYRTTTSS